MGIPAYFSYIIKNYQTILQKFQNTFGANQLYLDSNSIIYDSIRTIDYTGNNDVFERDLITAVCKQIEYYIRQISPSHLVYIAFDGVAPVAKLNQQKSRRYKSQYMREYDGANNKWDSTAITPGTEFMNKLNLQVQYYFRNAAVYNVKQIIISGSNIPGEGEHKIFEYIRSNEETIKSMRTVIYGLDADLIMLTLNHLHVCEDMYLFRETPEYIRSIDNSLDPNGLYVINMPEFKKKLGRYLNNDVEPSTMVEHNRVYDYILLCFMLGNDFLPHLPALNIRSGGMDILMNTYRNVIGTSKQNITNNGKIVWRNFRKIVAALADKEESYFQAEFNNRNKQEFKQIHVGEGASKFEKEMLHIPTKEREIEKYINPYDNYWEVRYYDMLFDVDIDDDWRKKISLNYLEGLEWTYKYYGSGCIDWRWSYSYHYPPLLKDMLKYIPYFDSELLSAKEKNPVSELLQLSYVLPRNSLHLLPVKVKNNLLQHVGHMYKDDYSFKWAYCKYFWESHVDFPLVNIQTLENIVKSIV